jgi:hypothetical protein
MNKAEEYINKNTRNDSNIAFDASFGYIPWLTPDQAEAAAKIAVEEYKERIYQEVQDFTDSYHKDPTDKLAESISKLIKSLGYVRENNPTQNRKMKVKVKETGEIIDVKRLCPVIYSRLDCNGKIAEEYDEDELEFIQPEKKKVLLDDVYGWMSDNLSKYVETDRGIYAGINLEKLNKDLHKFFEK